MRRPPLLKSCFWSALILLFLQLCVVVLLYWRSHHEDTIDDNLLADVQLFCNVSQTLGSPLIPWDTHILGRISSARACLLCGRSAPLAFAVLFRQVRILELRQRLQALGFTVELIRNIKPSETPQGVASSSPLALLVKRHVPLQLVLLHDRDGGFWWHGALSSDTEATRRLTSVGLSWASSGLAMRTEGAVDRAPGLRPTRLHGAPVLAPAQPTLLASQIKESRYIECRHSLAQEFSKVHGARDASPEALRFAQRAWTLLARAKAALDALGIRFWLSSGTLLGYYRQCGLITHSGDVDLGVFAAEHTSAIIPALTARGLTLKHIFGRENDSLEYSFLAGGLKLDLFFFYEDSSTGSFWNGGTQARTGRKFKYTFPRFTLCWTEFLELKVRVPCETQAYIEANYGPDWFTPVKDWDWKSSPPNSQPNGFWAKEQWPEVIQMHA